MAQQGVFGEVLRAQGAYIHNLDDFWPYYWKNGKEDKLGWRLRYNKEKPWRRIRYSRPWPCSSGIEYSPW